MAWRIHRFVLRGEIDNRERGRVRGSIWLHGRNEPITLDLSGNCSPDLAGCLVNFENPEPESPAKTDADLAAIETGVAGEITASRKVHAFAVPLDEALRLTKAGETPPILLENGFYLEWFSESNGRVVIESTDYQVDVSAPTWTPLPEDEEVQIAATQQAMREWLERADAALHARQSAAFEPDEEKPLDEFGYEKFMRESAARTDRYMELRENMGDIQTRKKSLRGRWVGYGWRKRWKPTSAGHFHRARKLRSHAGAKSNDRRHRLGAEWEGRHPSSADEARLRKRYGDVALLQ